MKAAAKQLEFERAAALRDEIQQIRLRVLQQDASITVGRAAERAGRAASGGARADRCRGPCARPAVRGGGPRGRPGHGGHQRDGAAGRRGAGRQRGRRPGDPAIDEGTVAEWLPGIRDEHEDAAGWQARWLDRPTWDRTVTPNIRKRTGQRPGRRRCLAGGPGSRQPRVRTCLGGMHTGAVLRRTVDPAARSRGRPGGRVRVQGCAAARPASRRASGSADHDGLTLDDQPAPGRRTRWSSRPSVRNTRARARQSRRRPVRPGHRGRAGPHRLRARGRAHGGSVERSSRSSSTVSGRPSIPDLFAPRRVTGGSGVRTACDPTGR